MRRVHIQVDEKGIFKNINCANAYYGFDAKAYEINLYHELPVIEEDDIFHGTLPMVRDALHSIGKVFPDSLETPYNLYGYLGRLMDESTLGEIRNMDWSIARPVHIKPIGTAKLFTGHVVKEFKDLIKSAGYDANTPIIRSTVVDIISEYRCFILNGTMIGASRYKGDFTIIPDMKLVQKIIDDFKDAPCAYSIDLGVLKNGKTILIEMNHAFSLGCYGLSSLYYANMIEARWIEMTR